MERIDLCRMNIAAELVVCMILLLLLVTCLVQRKRLATTKPLTILISVNLALMLSQVAGWGMAVESFDRGAEFALGLYPWRKLIYTLDYSLYYFLSVAYAQVMPTPQRSSRFIQRSSASAAAVPLRRDVSRICAEI